MADIETGTPGVINAAAVAGELADTWSPRVLAAVNDTWVKVARLDGEFVWHEHEAEDELFYVLEGDLTIRYEDRDDVELSAGDLHLVPRGVRHLPVTGSDGCLVMLVEPAVTEHTGKTTSGRTVSREAQLTGGGPGSDS